MSSQTIESLNTSLVYQRLSHILSVVPSVLISIVTDYCLTIRFDLLNDFLLLHSDSESMTDDNCYGLDPGSWQDFHHYNFTSPELCFDDSADSKRGITPITPCSPGRAITPITPCSPGRAITPITPCSPGRAITPITPCSPGLCANGFVEPEMQTQIKIIQADGIFITKKQMYQIFIHPLARSLSIINLPSINLKYCFLTYYTNKTIIANNNKFITIKDIFKCICDVYLKWYRDHTRNNGSLLYINEFDFLEEDNSLSVNVTHRY